MNEEKRRQLEQKKQVIHGEGRSAKQHDSCLLYTSDAADD